MDNITITTAEEHNVYACPMHPEVTQHERGTCPQCHMALEKQRHSKDKSQ